MIRLTLTVIYYFTGNLIIGLYPPLLKLATSFISTQFKLIYSDIIELNVKKYIISMPAADANRQKVLSYKVLL